MVLDKYVIQMAHGDKSVCPKGGRPEYRNQPWYALIGGREQGSRLKQKACGTGQRGDKPVCFKKIENKMYENMDAIFASFLAS